MTDVVTVREETVGAARVLTVDRPAKKNALDRRTVDDLAAAIERAADEPAIRGVVIAAAGDVYLAGGDLDELSSLARTVEGADAVLAMGARLDAIERSSIPVFAAITGDVYGWGYLMSGAVLTTLPVIAAYAYLQRYMVDGLTAGSVKG